jgi:hypothetical protein
MTKPWTLRILRSPDDDAGAGGAEDDKSKDGSGDEGDKSSKSQDTGTLTYPYENPETGKVEHLTPAEMNKRLRTYQGKAKEFDAAKRSEADALKEAKHSRTGMELYQKANKGDVEALRKLPDYPELGISQEMVDELLREKGLSTDENGKDERSEPDPETDKRVKRLEARDRKFKAREIDVALYQALDTDPVVGAIMKQSKDPKVKRFISRVRVAAIEELKRRSAERGDEEWELTMEDLKSAVQEARSFVKDMGWVDESSSDDDGSDGIPTLRIPTAGRSPGSSAGGVHRSRKPPERVPATEGEKYADYLTQRAEHLQGKKEGDDFFSKPLE